MNGGVHLKPLRQGMDPILWKATSLCTSLGEHGAGPIILKESLGQGNFSDGMSSQNIGSEACGVDLGYARPAKGRKDSLTVGQTVTSWYQTCQHHLRC
jgi:hypothetical protein